MRSVRVLTSRLIRVWELFDLVVILLIIPRASLVPTTQRYKLVWPSFSTITGQLGIYRIGYCRTGNFRDRLFSRISATGYSRAGNFREFLVRRGS